MDKYGLGQGVVALEKAEREPGGSFDNAYLAADKLLLGAPKL
jgi:hypothetical protein